MEKQNKDDDIDDWFDACNDTNVEIVNNSNLADTENDPLSSSILIDENLIMADNKSLCVDDIITMEPESITSAELMQYECSIAYFIQVMLEGNTNKIPGRSDIEFPLDKITSIIEYLKWISLSCGVLAKRIGQETISYVSSNFSSELKHVIPDSKPMIIRSSYNFCNKYTQCKNFYSKNESPTCREHHYVHSLLKYDIDSVICFLSYIIINNNQLEKDDMHNLYLSIKTICFVTRHMAKEINYIDYITRKNSETFHRNNPCELLKKKISVKNFSEKINNEKSFDRKIPGQTRGNKKLIGQGFRKNASISFNNSNRFSILNDDE